MLLSHKNELLTHNMDGSQIHYAERSFTKRNMYRFTCMHFEKQIMIGEKSEGTVVA